MNGRPLEDIAAFQWDSANRIALDDLAALPIDQWRPVRFEDFLRDPAGIVRSLYAFAEFEFDPALAARLAAPLPHSRQTHTPPSADKWQKNSALLDRVLPRLETTLARLRALR
jgi:hypothetical protein